MTTDNYISFAKAKKILTGNLGKEPSNEEFWLWCFWGRRSGEGIGAYVFESGWHNEEFWLWCFWGRRSGEGFESGWHDANVAEWLDSATSLSNRAELAEKWYFLRADIEAFEAKDRYLTGNELVIRWATMEGSEEGAIKVIDRWYTNALEPRNEGDMLPRLQNLYFGAMQTNETVTRDIKLGGIFSIKDVLAVEEHRGMKEPQAKAVGTGTGNHAGTEPKEREVMAWLRETWINEGKPGGTIFFTRLKKYVNQTGSPIMEHYNAGKDAGFRWETSAGATGRKTKKTILNIVSKFNSKP